MKPFRFILPLIALGLCSGIAVIIYHNRPEAARQIGGPPSVLSVEARVLFPTNYLVRVASRGEVRARTRTTLVSQVVGEVVEVSPAFRDGGFFREGDVLVQVDPRDYETAVVVAEATLKQAESALELERAQAAQAKADLKRLGLDGASDPLALRQPQLAEAEAAVASAQARLAEARRNRERTTIDAPYDGRVLNQQVDVGQFVNTGAPLASIYAVDYAEIRLPLSDKEFAFAGLSELKRPTITNPSRVIVSGDVGLERKTWEGFIARVEGAIDSQSRQHFVVAQVDDPYGLFSEDRAPLKVGQFVDAEIDGLTLTNVFLIPRSAVRNGTEVLVIDDANKLYRRTIEAIWGTESEVIARSGVSAGDLLCLTALPFAVDGTEATPNIEGRGARQLSPESGAGGAGAGPSQAGNEGGGPNPSGGPRGE